MESVGVRGFAEENLFSQANKNETRNTQINKKTKKENKIKEKEIKKKKKKKHPFFIVG